MNDIEEFQAKGFLVIRRMIQDTSELYSMMLSQCGTGMSDVQCPQSESFYNNETQPLHIMCIPVMEKLTGLKLFKTYAYHRIYQLGETLRIHKDRPACEISVTLCVGFKGKPWAIWILDYDENPNLVYLEPGDAIVYHGCDLYHWRGKNNVTWDHAQIFLHYVNQDGQYAWAKDDNKLII